jgi:lipoprotein-releasing system ATP-binding protein
VIVSLKNVSKTFQSGPATLTVLDSVSLELEKGEVAVVTGSSGSGKSTLLNLIGGLDTVSAGEIDACGYSVHSLGESEITSYRARSLGFVFQFHYLLKDFSALENVLLPAYMLGEEREAASARAEELLREVGLGERLSHFPSELSGGERQRAALARALINRPPLVLADEPTGNLDATTSAMVEDVLMSLVRSHGVTLLLVTHDERLARRGDRRFTLERGVIQEL